MSANKRGDGPLRTYLSGAEFAVIPNTGRLIPLEAPAELVQAISSFAPLD